MSDSNVTQERPNLARAVNELFRAANGILTLAERLVDVAEALPAGEQRSRILGIANELGSSANVIIRGQGRAVDAISRKIVL